MVENLINEALGKGLKSINEIVSYVTQNVSLDPARKPKRVQDEFIELENFSSAVDSLADKLSQAPFGDYGILSFKDGMGKTHWKGLISDGSGDRLQPELYGLYQRRPSHWMIMQDMLAGEVYKRLPVLVRHFQSKINIEIVKAHDLHEGSVLKNVQVPGYAKFSSAIIDSISKEGIVKLRGGYRGSSKKRVVTVPASSIQLS